MRKKKINRNPKPAICIISRSLYKFISWGAIKDTAVIERIYVLTSLPWGGMISGDKMTVKWPPDNFKRTFFFTFNNINMKDLKKVTDFRDSLVEQTELIAKYSEINSVPPDKKDERYKLAFQGHKDFRAMRLMLQKNLVKTITLIEQWKRDIKTKSATVINPLVIQENKLKALIEGADLIIEQEKTAKDNAKEKAYLAKTERLFTAGYAYNGQDYFSGDIRITPHEIDCAEEEHILKWEWHGIEIQRIEADEKAEADRIEKENIALREEEKQYKEQAAKKTQVQESPSTAETTPPETIPDNPLELFALPGCVTIKEDEDSEELGVDDPKNYKPEGYIIGFEACRKGVIEFLENGQPMKRSDLIEYIRKMEI